MFNVSESTVSRALKALETKGLIKRETKNVKGGKERHLHFTNSKMTVDSCEQPSNCLLTNVNLTIDNKQNELIKDNIKDKEKDNLGASLAPVVAEKAP
jgi:predicted transcriptional regulator